MDVEQILMQFFCIYNMIIFFANVLLLREIRRNVTSIIQRKSVKILFKNVSVSPTDLKIDVGKERRESKNIEGMFLIKANQPHDYG